MFAVLCTLSLAVPLFGPRAGAAVAGVVLLGAYVVPDGPLFDLLAYPGDYEDSRLYGLITFVLAGVALGLMATTASMPVAVFVGTILLVGYGNLGEQLVRLRTEDSVVRVASFCVTAIAAAVVGQAIVYSLAGDTVVSILPILIFLAASGTLLAALLRDVLLRSDDPIVVLSVGLLLWLLAELNPTIGLGGIIGALAVTVAFGYASYALETASIAGMLTGVLLGLLTIVLGDYGWFAVLISFSPSAGSRRSFATTESRPSASPRITTAHAVAATSSVMPPSRSLPSLATPPAMQVSCLANPNCSSSPSPAPSRPQ